MSLVSHLRRSALLLVAAALAVCSAGVPVAAAADATTTSELTYPTSFGLSSKAYAPFYIPPSPLPEGRPGDLIRAERMDFSKAISKPPVGTQGWRVMYLSTDALGRPMAVTGSVLVRSDQVPAQGVANRPIVTYGNEAQGLGDSCQVSTLLTDSRSGELDLIKPLLEVGYAVASSDFEGLGTPGTHTFGVSVSEAHAAIDIIRAARQLADAKLPQNGPIAMFGYSIGGGGIGKAAEIAPTYAPDLRFTAAAFGGAPINFLNASKNIDGGPSAAVNFLVSTGYDAAYPELRLADFLNQAGKNVQPRLLGSCYEIIPVLAFQWFKNYLVKDLRLDPKWQARFAENNLGSQGVTFPTYYFHSLIDETDPYADATRLRAAYCARGTKLRFVPIFGFDHIATGPVWMPQAAKWLAKRLQGQPDAGNCGLPAQYNWLG